MHKMGSQEITKQSYSFDSEEKLTELPLNDYIKILETIESSINNIEWLRKKYKETGDKRYWRLMIQLNPDGWLQRRTVTANYQVLRAQYFARKFHKQVEWRDYCKMIENLPYGLELICYKKEQKDNT